MKEKLNQLIKELEKDVHCEDREKTSFQNKLKETIKNQFPQATNFKDYCLINNFGFTFEINNQKFDCRFWANCYGCYLGYWSII